MASEAGAMTSIIGCTERDARERSRAAFLADVLDGLESQPRSIPGKYLWDDEGSRIYEAITHKPDYYHTAVEHALMQEALPDIATTLGAGACIVEFGSGASHKIRQLLDALETPARYVALDISGAFLEASAARLAADYPALEVLPVHADYSAPLPRLPIDRERPILGFFPGTSIGNMVPDAARQLLGRLREALHPGFLLIGQDPTRDPVRLQKAYEGPLMTALHKNLLVRLERELETEVDHDAYRHESRTFSTHVEPHLVAMRDTTLKVGGRTIQFRSGESIQTDLSWKYSTEEFSTLAVAAGWSVEKCWRDREDRFSLFLLRAD